MLSSLLLLSAYLQAARTCLPMDPGEELPCPSAPLITEEEVSGFIASPILMLEEKDGSLVYTCPAESGWPFPLGLVSIDDAGGMEFPLESNIVCRANSGQFVVSEGSKDTMIGNEKFGCGFDCSSCKDDSMEIFKPGDSECMGRTDYLECTGKPFRELEDDFYEGCYFLYCEKDSLVLLKKDKMHEVDLTQSAICASEHWQNYYFERPDDFIGYVCGKECTSCMSDLNKLFDASDEICTTRTDFMCTEKPVILTEDGCKYLKCGNSGSSLVMVVDKNKYNPSSDSICSFGTWEQYLFDIPREFMGFACANGCDTCTPPNLLEPTACDPTKVKCTSKPTVETKANNCAVIECKAGEMLFVVGATRSNSIRAAQCVAGKWQNSFDSITDPIGYACGAFPPISRKSRNTLRSEITSASFQKFMMNVTGHTGTRRSAKRIMN